MAMAGIASKIRRIGPTPVYTSPNPKVDIVFVHGLNGHPYNTWASTTNNAEVFWPTDLLPEVLPSVRIITYGYNANVSSFSDSVSTDHIHNHAETLASSLAANRSLKNCSDRPIIFVCHSLGGLVVKRALSYSKNIQNERTEHIRSIWVSTYGILFLGTPHLGSDIAKWGVLLQNICSAVMPKRVMDTSSNLVNALRTNNETLQNINSLFAEDMGRYHIYYFHETLKTDVRGTRELIVDEASAAPHAEGVERMGIEANHRNMCKFEDEMSPGYEAVAAALLRYSSDAPDTIAARWVEERQTRLLRKKAKAEEIFTQSEREDIMERTPNVPPPVTTTPGTTHLLSSSAFPGNPVMKNYEIEEPPEKTHGHANVFNRITHPRPHPQLQPPGSSEPAPVHRLLVAPPGFHPNATFYGMEKELDILHTRLYRARKRPNRLVAVLISGVRGSGKSHLARQYVWTNRDCYPGGIFWADAKSLESTYKCFWDIALGISQHYHDFHLPESSRSHGFVEIVRNWFQSHDGWLMVFDGLSFSSDEDLNNFKQFLPFKEKSSIIYTSVDKTLSRKQRLYEPYCLKMPPLEVKDACKLLFKDLNIKSPTPQEIRKATELVKHYECLPLAVHAMGHHLNNIAKPLEKYHIDSHLTDKKLAEPFLSIMHDLYRQEYFEALNLINLLSFLGHEVPVGLISFGRASLEAWNVQILTSAGPGEHPDIDTTLGILIRYGLIERVADRYALQAQAQPLSPRSEKESILDMKAVAPELSESQTESSQDAGLSIYANSSSIDRIKIHSVVQGFCRDELKIMDEEMRTKPAPAVKTMDEEMRKPAEIGRFYEAWLVVATRVFCTSYENAQNRMKVSGHGLVQDFREYETHASRLADHFPKRSHHHHHHESKIVREARENLRQVRRSISNEIERISPSSSQESIRKHRSVFDRSSSCSSSSIPDTNTPEDGPSRQLTWDLNEVAPEVEVESPQEMPRVPPSFKFSLRPFLPHIFRDSSIEKEIGYWTDNESEKTFPRISPVPSQTSHGTERPRPRSSQASSPPHQSDDQDWQVVKPKPKLVKEKRPWKQRPRFPRNIRRPKLAAPILKVETAPGRSASSGDIEGQSRRGSLSAEEALIAVHKGSPPQHNHRPPAMKENMPPTYATVAARSLRDADPLWKPRSSSSPGVPSRPGGTLPLTSKSSGDSLFSRSTPFSPDLRAERLSQSTYSEPDPAYLTEELNALDLNLRASLNPRYQSRHLAARRGPPLDMSASTPLLQPLPYEGNIDVSLAPHRAAAGVTKPATLSQSTTNISSISHPSAFMPGVSRPPSVTVEGAPPPGYASDPAPEPMSRGPSGQSYQSWSTEPAHLQQRVSPMPAPGPGLGPGALPSLAPGAPPAVPQQHVLYGTGSWAGEQSHPLPQPVAQTLYLGAHRVDIADSRQRLVGPRPYDAPIPQMIAPYNPYHSNLSGPLIHHEIPLQQELRTVRPRSGSSPTHAVFDM
ncbi:hypothetical protein BDV59DRAFT_198528 [Aspergillus ambiguus]|uniref:LipA and NB-ARC domain protein n=1 Tax=Aspergillus ambiguus TaxID=176160 RepID=UPI003CCD229E